MAKTLCLLLSVLLGLAVAHPMGGGGGGGDMAGFSQEKMERLGMLIHLEEALREKTEQTIDENSEDIEEIHQQFVK